MTSNFSALLLALSPFILFGLALAIVAGLIMWAEWTTQRFEDPEE